MKEYELIKELNNLRKREFEIRDELRDLFKKHFDQNRQFANGEVVSVFRNGIYQTDGIVVSGHIMRVDDSSIDSLAKDKTKLEKHIANHRYDVRKIKKDGTASAHNVSWSRSLGSDNDTYECYIAKKITEPA